MSFFGVRRGEQHPRHRQDALAAALAQPVESGADHRVGELQVAVLHRPFGRQMGRQRAGPGPRTPLPRRPRASRARRAAPRSAAPRRSSLGLLAGPVVVGRGVVLRLGARLGLPTLPGGPQPSRHGGAYGGAGDPVVVPRGFAQMADMRPPQARRGRPRRRSRGWFSASCPQCAGGRGATLDDAGSGPRCGSASRGAPFGPRGGVVGADCRSGRRSRQAVTAQPSMSARSRFISAISSRWVAMMPSASSRTRGSSMPARSEVRMAMEWCGIMARM